MITHYKPGTPEFAAIAKQITPIGRVRSGLSQRTTYIDAEPQNTPIAVKRRGEDVTKSRG